LWETAQNARNAKPWAARIAAVSVGAVALPLSASIWRIAEVARMFIMPDLSGTTRLFKRKPSWPSGLGWMRLAKNASFLSRVTKQNTSQGLEIMHNIRSQLQM
jgi:hypothetical protein